MSNRRAKGKRLIGFWAEEEVIGMLDSLAAEQETSRARVLTDFILQEYASRPVRHRPSRRKRPQKSAAKK